MIVICNNPATHIELNPDILRDLSCHDLRTCCAIFGKRYNYNFVLDTLRQLIFPNGSHSILVSPATFCYGSCRTIRKNAIRMLRDLLQANSYFEYSFISPNLEAIYSTEQHFLLIHKRYFDSRLTNVEIKAIITATQIFDNPIREKLFLKRGWRKVKQALQQFFKTHDPRIIEYAIRLPKATRLRTNLKLRRKQSYAPQKHI